MDKNSSLLYQTWQFIWARKSWWLIPIIILLLLVGVLIVAGQSSYLSPFIYSLF
ncbi:MAG TPA: DUF5989 family protein [Candidatus Paceibacterota bacterium]|nr:DUF5989 family protein [Candidatus Paceibacterota bacterium]